MSEKGRGTWYVRVQAGEILAVEVNLTRVGREVAADQAEQAGLAGAVRSHDAHDVALLDGQRQLFGHHHAAELLGDAVQFKQHGHAASIRRLELGLDRHGRVQ
jgi:hypothetical protein